MAMFSLLPAKPKNAFYFSVALHLILITVLIVSFDFSSPMPVVENSANKEIINAVVMDALQKPSKILQKPIPTPPAPPAPPKPVETPPVVKAVEPKPDKPVAKAKPTPAPVAKSVIAIADKKQKKIKEDLIQKQLLADLKKQTPSPPKKIKQSSIEADFAKEMNEIKAKSLQQQMLQEQKRLASVMTQQTHGVVDKYKALILQQISQNWIIPNNINKHLTAELLIRVAPGGVVLDVQLVKSSGDESLDRSARAAVFKSSPLPVPTDMDAFASFKQFVLKVKPENVLLTDNVV